MMGSRLNITSKYEAIILSITGNTKGAVAFCLILVAQSQNQEILKNTIVASILYTVVIVGSILGYIINYLQQRQSEQLSQDQDTSSQKLLKSKKVKSQFEKFDNRYLRNYLIYNYQQQFEDDDLEVDVAQSEQTSIQNQEYFQQKKFDEQESKIDLKWSSFQQKKEILNVNNTLFQSYDQSKHFEDNKNLSNYNESLDQNFFPKEQQDKNNQNTYFNDDSQNIIQDQVKTQKKSSLKIIKRQSTLEKIQDIDMMKKNLRQSKVVFGMDGEEFQNQIQEISIPNKDENNSDSDSHSDEQDKSDNEEI